MVMPIDAKRSRFMKREEKERIAAADGARMKELAKPSSRDRPAWMDRKDLLPKAPPTKSGRP
jgi:hypothetical protein